ncbi:MAG: hypothetical protein ACRDQ5_28180 [Sciscionella sp.]
MMSEDGASRPDHEVISLDLFTPKAVRRRALTVVIGAVIMGAAFGGIVGLIGGRVAGLIAAAVVGVPLVLLAWSESRRRVWLDDETVAVRAFGTRRVDLRQVNRMELLITQTRGSRTVGVLVAGPPKSKTINLAVANYTGTVGNELGIVPLRRLANALAKSENTNGLVYSELLVAQLRAEARGEPAEGRPLHQLAAAAPSGRLAQRIGQDAVVRFVSSLE